ncbi:MAG: Hsp20/alpha crystallin family protein [Candidatus Azambacteria bacterium]|nr:Hsp20/alpha crystallin family protein [Candidatus Azambacteria bacterium]
MKKEEQKKEEKSRKGEISLDDIPFVGGLLKGLEKFIDLAERAEEVGGELKRSGHIKGLGGHKDIHGVYGFTVRTGLGQKTKVEPFGNIKKTKEGPKVSETREPIVDVFDEKDHILIIAELPGIDEKSIELELKKDIILLEAGGGNRKYSKEILLKDKIDFDSREMSFKNGILEVKFKKTK